MAADKPFGFRTHPTVLSFARYLGAMAFNLPLSIMLLFLFHDLAHLPMIIASPLATIALFVANYFLSAWAIVGGKPKASEAKEP